MNNVDISKVYLLSVPLENDYKHTLYFTNKDTQNSYFMSKKIKESSSFSYLRKEQEIHVPYHYDTIYNCNYLMYQNSKYNNKWFYCFIKSMKYENDECTILEIETDVIQTWMFDYTIKPSFVEREHVSDDTIGVHTVDEGLETGDYITMYQMSDGTTEEMCIVMAYSDYADGKYNVLGANYGGVYSGVGYSAFKLNNTGIKALNELLSAYDKDAAANGVVAIFMVPKWMVYEEPEGERLSVLSRQEPIENSVSFPKLSKLNGYKPRNQKLLTYPFTFLDLYNGNGSNAIYKIELFEGDTINFKMFGVVTPGCSIRILPVDYDNVPHNHQYGLNGGKYPICCWVSDAYTNWMTENSVNNALSVVGSAASMIGGAAMMATGAGAMAGAGMIAGGLMGITNTMRQVHQASLVPDQVKGNVNCGDVVTGMKANKFIFYYKSIKKEWAERLDKYFDMFGYKVNVVKTPNKAHRSRYWYTKTIDINIDGSIPSEDMQKIKNVYDNGITFWRNATEIQNYDLTNEIV